MDWQIEWLAPNILSVTMRGELYFEDFEQLVREAIVHLDTATSPVYIVTSVLNLTYFENNIKHYAEILQPYYQHKNYGISQLVTHHPVHRLIASVASRFSGAKWRACNSVEEALAYIEKLEQVPKS